MNANQPRPLRPSEWLLFVALLLAFALQAMLSSPSKSAAFDEQYHVAAGYAYLRTGDFRMSLSHPPLINLISALPLLTLEDIRLPTDHPSWQAGDYFQFADVFLWQVNDNPQQILEWARVPVVILGLLLLLGLFFWARQMIGAPAGWLIIFLAAFDPNLLANARLVTTDLGLACFLLLALWRFWRWLESPTKANYVVAGLLAGLTMASKFTGIFIWPILVGILLIYPGYNHKRWLQLLGLVPIAYLALWAVYRFDIGPVPGSPISLPIPAPFYPYSMWDTFRVIEEQPKPAFLFGQVSNRGWWYYFPVTLAVKTPLPTLLLAFGGSAWLGRSRGWRRASVVWMPFLAFLTLTMTGRIAIGYRHILPALPFLLMLGGYATKWIAPWPQRTELASLVKPPAVGRIRARRSWLGLLLLLGLVLWEMVGTARLYPHQEAFFNEMVGGPDRGSQVLVDANIDWGQDLPALRELMAERGVDQVYLGYFGTAWPEAYGIKYWPAPGFLRFTGGAEIDAFNPYSPPPGWYAISVTGLRLGLLYQNRDIYAFFRGLEPEGRAGYSINLYRVTYPEALPVVRRVVKGQAVSDLPPEDLGWQPGERLIAKWAASEQTQIFFAGEGIDYPPAYSQMDYNFDDAFILQGIDLPSMTTYPGQALELTLYWQVGKAGVAAPSPAAAPPLAAFVHLSAADPAQIIAQYDGWQTALTGLEPGDVIVQPVTLTVPDGVSPGDYYLRVGLYSPQSGQRLPVSVRGQVADFVTLPQLVKVLAGTASGSEPD
ncbi:MAG: ArnT family glycosyltransferase [Candidatus Promineifilaceae bacterium]